MTSKQQTYDDFIALDPDIERKGKTVPYTSLNGHMFSFLGKDGTIGLRLSKEEREKFMDKYKVEQPVQYGAVMKEYVAMPPELLNDKKVAAKYLKLSFKYVSTLRPK